MRLVTPALGALSVVLLVTMSSGCEKSRPVATGTAPVLGSPRYELRDAATGRYRVLLRQAARSLNGGRYYCQLHPPDLPGHETIVTDSATGRRLRAEIVDSRGARACGMTMDGPASWLRVELPRDLPQDEWLPLLIDSEVRNPEVFHQRGDTLEFTQWAAMSGDYVILPPGYAPVPSGNVTRVDTLPDHRIALRISQITAIPTRLEVRAVRR